MEPWVLVVLTACAVAVSAALVAVLLALRTLALRADTVLGLLEREVRPLASEVHAVLAEARELSQRINKEMERLSGIVQRAEEASAQVARVAQAVGAFTRVGQVAGLVIGLKRGADVFMRRLREP